MFLCKQCGTPVLTRVSDKMGDFCSWKCYERWQKFNHAPNCCCKICGKPFYVKPSRLNKRKYGVTCSTKCGIELRRKFSTGKNNHQYGLVGAMNSSFKSGAVKTNYGYLLEYVPGHPFPHDCSNKTIRVYQHRLVVERNYQLFPQEAFIVINGKHYLKKEYAVHHINEVKTDNRIENLQVMTKGEHSRLHCKQNKIIRDTTNGRIIGVLKLGKNDELCEGNIVLTFSDCARRRRQCRA